MIKCYAPSDGQKYDKVEQYENIPQREYDWDSCMELPSVISFSTVKVLNQNQQWVQNIMSKGHDADEDEKKVFDPILTQLRDLLPVDNMQHIEVWDYFKIMLWPFTNFEADDQTKSNLMRRFIVALVLALANDSKAALNDYLKYMSIFYKTQNPDVTFDRFKLDTNSREVRFTNDVKDLIRNIVNVNFEWLTLKGLTKGWDRGMQMARINQILEKKQVVFTKLFQ